MHLKEHIFFTGFMGSGKSTYAKKTAAQWQVPFIDLDVEISRRNNKSIAAIFEEYGEDHFRNQEKNVLTELIRSAATPHIFALGGGSICFNNVAELVLKNGLLIYLQADAKTLLHRIEESKTPRPLLKGKTGMELLSFIENLLKQREVYYNRAHIKLPVINLTTSKIISSIESWYTK